MSLLMKSAALAALLAAAVVLAVAAHSDHRVAALGCLGGGVVVRAAGRADTGRRSALSLRDRALAKLDELTRIGSTAERSPQGPASRARSPPWSPSLLLAAATARPAVRTSGVAQLRPEAQAYFLIDISRSMLARRGPRGETRFARALAAADTIRSGLADIPAGVASLTDRPLPHLFPSANRSVLLRGPPPGTRDRAPTAGERPGHAADGGDEPGVDRPVLQCGLLRPAGAAPTRDPVQRRREHVVLARRTGDGAPRRAHSPAGRPLLERRGARVLRGPGGAVPTRRRLAGWSSRPTRRSRRCCRSRSSSAGETPARTGVALRVPSVAMRVARARAYAEGMRASSASASASRTGSSSIRSSTSWKKPRTISRSASARDRPRAIR
jgi:hypothetical protein